jgi:hypothetical protein
MTDKSQFQPFQYRPQQQDFMKYVTISHALLQAIATRRGRDNSVGIATGYGLDGPGIESRWGARFSAPVLWVPPSFLYDGYRVFPGGKAAGQWR